ncbi:MAG: amidinotransferase [Deltaproteobacteria bacterium]|nr:amidinotransferase [Candidatus Zymogenaceae bacterium]
MRKDGSDFFAYRYTRGIVRCPGPELTGALSRNGAAAAIDVEQARTQHARYVKILEGLGIDLIHVPADPAFPDGCFVEDTCVMLPQIAVITAPGAPSRRGESLSVQQAVAPHREIRRMTDAGTLDGGDVLRLARTYLIGRSGRTNAEGAEELGRIVKQNGADYRIVDVAQGLHLKSAVTPLAPDTVLGLSSFLGDRAFTDIKKIVVPEDEAPAACAVAANGTVIVADGFPETRQRLERAGFSVIACDISEFAKADGGLTCLSVLW